MQCAFLSLMEFSFEVEFNTGECSCPYMHADNESKSNLSRHTPFGDFHITKQMESRDFIEVMDLVLITKLFSVHAAYINVKANASKLVLAILTGVFSIHPPSLWTV